MAALKLSTLFSKICIRDVNIGLSKCYSPGPPIYHTDFQPQIRYKNNKPRWLPKAPSKIYKVTGRRRLPPRETAERLRLFHNYKCFMKLIYEHCKAENLKLSDKGEITEKLLEEEEKEHKQLMEYNLKENERISKLRSQRIEEEKEKLLFEILEFKTREMARENIIREDALKLLENTEKLALTLIKPDQITAAIEHAIDNPIDHNFSINLEGNIFRGRNTLPHLVDTDNLEVLAVQDDGYGM